MRGAPELAEAIGTFALVFVGCGAIMVDALTGALGHLGVSIAFGLVIGAMVYAVGHVSGGHFNPAVTLAFAATGHFPWRRVARYWLAQIAGATAAAFLLRWLLGDVADVGATQISDLVTKPGAWVIEVAITALLMFVIASVATDGRAVGSLAGSAIGSTVAMMSLWAGPLTGASMNPARSLGPFLAAGSWDDVLLFMLAPLAGAFLGALLYAATRRGETPQQRPT